MWKYGGDVNDVLDYFDNIIKEYSLLIGSEEFLDVLEKELKILEYDLIELVN